MLRMLTKQVAGESVSVTEGWKNQPTTKLLLLLINCGIYRLVSPSHSGQVNTNAHPHVCGKWLKVCSNSSRIEELHPQVRAVCDNVSCNKTQESLVASLLPQEWVVCSTLVLVEN